MDDERARSSDIYRLSVVLNRRMLGLLDAADKKDLILSLDELGKIGVVPRFASLTFYVAKIIKNVIGHRAIFLITTSNNFLIIHNMIITF